MAFPNDAAHPDYSGLLVPEIWSPRVLEKFYEFSVLEYIANTDYEGEIRKYGDKVNIRLRPDIAINDYDAGQELDFQRPEQAMTELLIDKGKYWNFMIEDVNLAQSDLDYLEEWTSDAAEAMNEVINESVLAVLPGTVAAENQGPTAGVRTQYYNLGESGATVAIDKTNVIDILGDCAAVLSEQKAPESNRWMVIPPWFKAMIFSSDIRNALVTGNDQVLLRKGHIGNLAGFELFESNQVPMTDNAGTLETTIMFGHIKSLTFASQLINSDVIRSERYFGRFARGLNVYGHNTVKPSVMGQLVASRA